MHMHFASVGVCFGKMLVPYSKGTGSDASYQIHVATYMYEIGSVKKRQLFQGQMRSVYYIKK